MANNTVYRLGELEKNYKDINDKIDIIRTNHLPHIQEELTSLKTRINVMTAINIAGIILGIVVAKWFA